jgi:hypothetical protein
MLATEVIISTSLKLATRKPQKNTTTKYNIILAVVSYAS